MYIESLSRTRSFWYLSIFLGCFEVNALNADLHMFSGIIYAIENGSDIVVKDPGSFLDSTGRLNIIGVVDNNGDYPIGGVPSSFLTSLYG